jgi:hypothetical protein
VTYKRGFRLDDWIYGHLIHSIRDYRSYSAIADLHFTVHRYTCTRVLSLHQTYPGNGLITDTAAHMKSSLHSLIPFLPLLLSHIRLPSLSVPWCNCQCQLRNSTQFQFLCSYPGTLASRNSTNSNDLLCPFYNSSAQTTQKTQPLYC